MQLNKFGQRFYDPSLGRWTMPDPADRAGIRLGNDWLYAGDDPVNLADPTGQVACASLDTSSCLSSSSSGAYVIVPPSSSNSFIEHVLGGFMVVGGGAVFGACEYFSAGAATPECIEGASPFIGAGAFALGQ